MFRYRSPLPYVANAAAETRAVRGQLTGDRRGMTSRESLKLLEPARPTHARLRIVE